jgi:hypothetical protein
VKKKTAPQGFDDLKAAPYNPRTISAQASAGLSVSLGEMGDLSGIVWNRRTGNLVAGHQRVEQLRAMGAIFDAPSGKILDERNNHDYYIRIVDWPIEKEKIANLAANNPAIQGQFTSEVGSLLAEIEAGQPDLLDGLMLDKIVPAEELEVESGGNPAVEGGPPDMELRPFEHYDYIVILADNTMDWEFLCEHFGIEKVNASPIPGKRKIGLGRAIRASKVIEKIKNDS